MRPEAMQKLREGTVIPAFPLALNENRSFNETYQRALIRYYLDAGAGGLAVGVHTTQFEIRDPNVGLYEPLLRIGHEEVEAYENRTGKTIIKIAGVCGPTQQAVKEASLAKNLGYDAVLLSTGSLSSYSEDMLIERAGMIADVLPVIGFYLQPSVGGRLLSYDYWCRLCEINGVIAIKAAPFNRYQTLDVVRAAAFSSRSDQISLYTGNDDNIVVDLLSSFEFRKDNKVYRKRFVGGLLGHWSMWTHTVVAIFERLKKASGQEEIPRELLTLANQITDCNAAFFDAANGFRGVIPGVHEVLRRQGLLKGIWCLDPEETLSPGQKEEIDRVYDMYPHLNDDLFVRENLHKWLES